MNKVVAALVAVSLLATPAMAGQVNQFEIAQHNRQYNQSGGYPPPPPPYPHRRHHHNDNGAAWAAGVGGFIGGFLLGNINNGYEYGEPYVPPAYIVPGQPVERCGTAWTMEPDGFGGWQRAPHTVCGWN